jgi:hypothetical protein
MISLNRPGRTVGLILVVATCAYATMAAPAAASNPLKRACRVAGAVSGVLSKACDVVADPGRVLKAGKKLVTGHPGGAVTTLIGGGATAATAALGLSAIGAWVLTGARFALHQTATLIDKTTGPQLATSWFSSTYWRMAGIAAVLTLPFLFAAAVQALLRSDLALLVRAALGYLPLAMLAIAIAAPLTMLLLAASDQMSAVVSSAAGNSGARYLATAAGTVGGLAALAGAPFIAFLIGLLTAAGAVVLWLELLMRDAAVYVIVLMLPLVFAALVWPSRRIWAVRAVELLVALIFAKFAVVAVLSLGGAALSGGAMQSVAGWLAGLVILVMGAFAPWAMLRLLPLAEIASNAVQSLHADGRAVTQPLNVVHGLANRGHEWATTTTAQMRRDREAASEAFDVAHAPELPALEQTTGSGAGVADDGADTPGVPESQPTSEPSAQAGGRLADLGGQWQEDNFAWRRLRLGPEENWPNPTVWSPAGATPAGPGMSSSGGTPPPADPGPTAAAPFGGAAAAMPPPPAATQTAEPPAPATIRATGSDPTSTQDDADPLPPVQDPPEGRL